MRFVFGVAVVLSVGIGAFFGSAQVAGSTKVPPKTVTMGIGDVAVVGPVQCLAWTDSRRFPIRRAYMRCSAGPKEQAPYLVDIGANAVAVWKKGTPQPVYTASG